MCSLLAVVAVIGGLADSVERRVYMPDGSRSRASAVTIEKAWMAVG